MKKCKSCGKEIIVRLGNYVNYYVPADLTNPNANKMESYHLACFTAYLHIDREDVL